MSGEKIPLHTGIIARGKTTAKEEVECYTIVISIKFRMFSPTRKKNYLPEEKIMEIIAFYPWVWGYIHLSVWCIFRNGDNLISLKSGVFILYPGFQEYYYSVVPKFGDVIFFSILDSRYTIFKRSLKIQIHFLNTSISEDTSAYKKNCFSRWPFSRPVGIRLLQQSDVVSWEFYLDSSTF